MMLKSQFFNTFSFKLIFFSTIFCLILNFTLGGLIKNLLIFSGILSFGVIHGANDLILLKKKLNNKEITIFSLFFPYLSMVFLFGLFFYFFPSFALIFFVLFSSYHFGEQQWTMFIKKKEKKLRVFYFSFGLFLFSVLFWINSQSVINIINDITGVLIISVFFDYLLGLSMVGLLFFGFLNYRLLIDQIIVQFILLVLLTLLFFNSDLIYAFGVYFVFWHSIPSILEQSNFIFGSSDIKSFISYLRYAFIYWILSLIGLFILYYFLKDHQILILSIFFSFLAAITFPHTIVIFKIKGN